MSLAAAGARVALELFKFSWIGLAPRLSHSSGQHWMIDMKFGGRFGIQDNDSMDGTAYQAKQDAAHDKAGCHAGTVVYK